MSQKARLQKEKEKLMKRKELQNEMGVYIGYKQSSNVESEKNKLIEAFNNSSDYEEKKEILSQLEMISGTKLIDLRMDLEAIKGKSR